MKEFTKSYGIKRVAELTEEIESLRSAIKTYQEINKRTTDALVEACDELAKYKMEHSLTYIVILFLFFSHLHY